MYTSPRDLTDAQGALIRQFQNEDTAVDVHGIAAAYRIDIEEIDLGDRDGELCRIDEAVYCIRVNSKHPANRQRFTVAHELAHYILHKEEIGVNDCIDRGTRVGLQDKKEIEANRLAADILMPTDLVRRLLRDREMSSIKKLAETLAVSENALRIRFNV